MHKRFFILFLVMVFIGGCKKEAEFAVPEERGAGGEEGFPMLDVDAYFEGTIDTDGDYTIQGRMKGTIIATGTVVIDETGIVECDRIEASDVIVKGHVTGNIKAINEIRVDPTGIVIGETFCKNLVINGGSIFQAGSKMPEPKKRVRER